MNRDGMSGIWARQGLCLDWIRRLRHSLHADDEASCAQKLCEFQGDNGLEITGFVDAATRLALIDSFPELRIQLIGNHLQPRCLFENTLSDGAVYDRCEAILMSRHAWVMPLDEGLQILAVRGVQKTSEGWFRTSTARDFAETPYGSRVHFSAARPDYADAMIAVLWRTSGRKNVRLFCGNVNPCAIWPHGTAHLNHGQYFYKIGRHRTREPAHIDAVLQMAEKWPENWIYDRTEDSVQYIALEGTSDIEVIRSHGESLDISDEDVRNAEMAIAHRDLTYVDALRIKINIHTCAFNRASSLGCQNILPQDYADFMQLLLDAAERQIRRYGFALEIPYTIVDASMNE